MNKSKSINYYFVNKNYLIQNIHVVQTVITTMDYNNMLNYINFPVIGVKSIVFDNYLSNKPLHNG